MIQGLRITVSAVALATFITAPASAGGPTRNFPLPKSEPHVVTSAVDTAAAPTDTQALADALDLDALELPAGTDACSPAESLTTPLDQAVSQRVTDGSASLGLCRGNLIGDCPTLRDKECWPICGRNHGYCILIFNCETQCVCQ